MRILWMRIGVITRMQHSFFSGSAPIAIAEALKHFGDVHLITTGADWWDDCSSVRSSWTVVRLQDASGYDLCIEYGETLSADQRFAKKHVWFTTNFLIKEIEQSIFPMQTPLRDLGVNEIWTDEDSKEALEVLTGLPVHVLPFIWSPTFISAYAADRPWTPGPWKVHCIETHTTNTSSAVLPLVILKEARARGCPIESIRVHNASEIQRTQYFQENTLNLCSGPIDFLGRQRFADWLHEPGSCVVSHTRFRPIRPALLDLLWCGIPFIHNSPMLADFGNYYEGNKVGQAVSIFQHLKAPDRAADRIKMAQWFPETAIPALKGILKPKECLRIGFCDMWSDFNPSYNFFTLLMQHVAPHLEIAGGIAQGAEDIIIFGPFGSAWKGFPGPKIHFTGENTPPVPEADLNLGFQCGNNYLRFPLWILEIDWFGASARINNPIPIPLSLCRSPPKNVREKFCAFVVSNPVNPVRNEAFQTLNNYKPVDSAGRVFNTLGPDLFAGPGGGGGEAKKVEFLKDYRFCIAYENCAAPGYCTEKLLHAKAAGCVPIYWGDPLVEQDFDPAGFIDARALTPEGLIAAVQAAEDPEVWAKMAAVPALSEAKIEWARETMADLGQRILALATGRPETYVINLDRRPDRMKRLTVQASRWPAVDGLSLELTPGLRALLANNDFFWKKAVAGCALSHLGLWKKLADSDRQGYLILEDDVVMHSGLDTFRNLEMPDDLDILYLGGVLPPNRQAFDLVIEGSPIGRIKPNQLYGQPVPTRYFHFCAYAYYLTKRGAQKILAAIKERGIWTSADHILCNPEILTAYVMNPLIAGCYQDTDPVYKASKFNDFNRIDSFDSDLWNNDERFL